MYGRCTSFLVAPEIVVHVYDRKEATNFLLIEIEQ